MYLVTLGGVNEVVLIVLTSVTDQKWIKLNEDITLNRNMYMWVGVWLHAFMHALCVYVYCTCACIFIDTDAQIGIHLLWDCSCNGIAVLKAWLSIRDLFSLVDSLQTQIFSTLNVKNIHFYIHIKSSKKASSEHCIWMYEIHRMAVKVSRFKSIRL
jgi:hypothetical protein